ncbi:MAG: S-layer homology domain-containing protein [Andreesenia angusta]|nr:S-layer homology domain-containing protein [Andreesenia angusta]
MKRKIFSLALASTLALGSISAFADEAELIVNKPFIEGYGDKTVRPDSEIKRGEIAKIVAEAYEIAKADNKFPDVAAEHWASQFIGGLQDKKIVEGDPDGNYRPEDLLTRAEFAAIVSRASDLEGEGEAVVFNDTDDHWAKDIIKELSKAGIVEGYGDGSFKPEKKVTRAEAVSMVLRALGRNIDKNISAKVVNPFTDLNDKAWYLDNMLAASTEFEYRILDNGQEEIAVQADSKVINSIEVPAQAFDKNKKARVVKVRANGSTEALDLNQLKTNGYTIKFIQVDSDGNAVKKDFVFETGTAESEDGKLADGIKTGDYKVHVVIQKETSDPNVLEFVARHTGTVSIVDNIVESTEAIKDVALEEIDSKTKIKNGTLVSGETVEIKKLLADVDGKKDVDIIADGLDYKLSSSNVNILSANNETKIIKANSLGKAKITVTIGKAKKEIELTVVKDKRKASSIKNTDEVRLAGAGSEKSIEVEVLDQYGDVMENADIVAVYDEDKLEYKLTDNILTITSKEDEKYSGVIYIRPGNDKKEIGQIKVNVGNQIGKSSLALEIAPGEKESIKVGKTTKIVPVKKDSEGKVLPLDDIITNVTLSDENIAEVSNTDKEITLTGLKEGTVTVTAVIDKKTYSIDVEVTAEKEYNVTDVTFNTNVSTNVVKGYTIEDFLKLSAIKHDKATTKDITLADNKLSVDSSDIGTISVSVKKYNDEGKYDSEKSIALEDKDTEIVNTADVKKADVTVKVLDNNGKEIGSRTFNLDTLN